MHNKVLVVDDDEVVVTFVREVLEPEGFQVVSTAYGRVALNMMRQEPPGLILCDYYLCDFYLSGYSGVDLLKDRAAYEELVQIPCIVMSVDVECRSECKHAGAADFLPKPFSASDLLEAVHNVLG